MKRIRKLFHKILPIYVNTNVVFDSFLFRRMKFILLTCFSYYMVSGEGSNRNLNEYRMFDISLPNRIFSRIKFDYNVLLLAQVDKVGILK